MTHRPHARLLQVLGRLTDCKTIWLEHSRITIVEQCHTITLTEHDDTGDGISPLILHPSGRDLTGV
jgi:hypothetical protein